MKLVAIYGSPRKNGNTDLMMEAFLTGATEYRERTSGKNLCQGAEDFRVFGLRRMR